MNIEVLKKEKDFLEVKLVGADEGLANLVVKKLLDDYKMEFAAAKADHPLTANPVILVKGSDAQKNLKSALKDCAKEFKQAIALAEKA
ncbi:hypothetical protein HY993_03770 [Candidatus Micrarchaeota archaeon]|nr:hypothetical protein [Candidatus Micrarchaeota archaeon]